MHFFPFLVSLVSLLTACTLQFASTFSFSGVYEYFSGYYFISAFLCVQHKVFEPSPKCRCAIQIPTWTAMAWCLVLQCIWLFDFDEHENEHATNYHLIDCANNRIGIFNVSHFSIELMFCSWTQIYNIYIGFPIACNLMRCPMIIFMSKWGIKKMKMNMLCNEKQNVNNRHNGHNPNCSALYGDVPEPIVFFYSSLLCRTNYTMQYHF